MSTKQIPLSTFSNALLQRQSAFQASAESDHSAKFPAGVKADPTKNMSDEQKAEWAKQKELHGDKFKKDKAAADEAESDTDAKFEKGKDVPLKDMPAKLQDNAKNPPPEVKALKEKMKSKKAFIDDNTLDQLIDMAMESSEIEGSVSGDGWRDADKARDVWNKAVSVHLGKWLQRNIDKVDQNSRPLRRVRDGDIRAIVEVLQHHRGGAGYLYYMEAEGHGVGTWDGDWDQLFIDGSDTVDELSKHMERATKREYGSLQTAIDNAAYSASSDDDDDDGKYASVTRQRLTWDPAVRAKLASRRVEAKAAAGLYGYTKKVQADCEACSRKLARKTASIARAAWNKDERVASFLQTHAKRSKSRSAKLLVAALKNLGPKVASQMDKTAGSGAANATYLDSLPGMEKLKILKHLAKHYGVSVREIEDEVKDRDAEALYEYTATDRSMTMGIYNDFKRMRLASDHEAATQWVGYVEEDGGKMVRFFGPTSKGALTKAFRKHPDAETTMITVEHAMENFTSLLTRKPSDIWFKTLPSKDKKVLEGLIKQRSEQEATKSKTASYGMYGASAKVARLGLTACASLKEAAGELSADLHRRRASAHASYTGFLGEHSKTAKDGYSRMLLGFYPDSTSKIASIAPPDSVDEWLSWEE